MYVIVGILKSRVSWWATMGIKLWQNLSYRKTWWGHNTFQRRVVFYTFLLGIWNWIGSQFIGRIFQLVRDSEIWVPVAKLAFKISVTLEISGWFLTRPFLEHLASLCTGFNLFLQWHITFLIEGTTIFHRTVKIFFNHV